MSVIPFAERNFVVEQSQAEAHTFKIHVSHTSCMSPDAQVKMHVLCNSVTGFLTLKAQLTSFCAEKHPELKLGEVSRKLGEMWRDLSEEDKTPYKVHPSWPVSNKNASCSVPLCARPANATLMLALQDLATAEKEQLQQAQPAEITKKPTIKAAPMKDQKAPTQEPRAQTAYNVRPELHCAAICFIHHCAACELL